MTNALPGKAELDVIHGVVYSSRIFFFISIDIICSYTVLCVRESKFLELSCISREFCMSSSAVVIFFRHGLRWITDTALAMLCVSISLHEITREGEILISSLSAVINHNQLLFFLIVAISRDSNHIGRAHDL